MALDLNSSRQRGLSRRALLTLALGCLLALTCLLLPAARWGAAPEPETAALGAPPDAATRPNPPTEPIRGPVEASAER